ncbi:MAG: alpha-galactosidase [Clostridium sp.]
MYSYGKGDIREPFIEIIHSDGISTCDFLFDSFEIIKGKEPLKTLPSSYDENNQVEELRVTLKDAQYKIKLIISYFVYEKCDVITRTSKVINEGDDEIRLERLMSNQIDFDHNEFIFTNFTGAWAREVNRNDHICNQGKIINSSNAGVSSNRNNPFVMISERDATEDFGCCYGMNLIYSGNHYEAIETNSYGKLRFESKIMKMAKAAKEVGVELFVIDDGWFGKRNDDTTSLGDWNVNYKKLPGGIKGISEKINELGMVLGIWVEPERLNEDSDCYRNHPDWAVKIPGKPHSEGRNQMILDLTMEEVQEFIIKEMSTVFESGNITYVKWDMNRIFSDCFSMGLNSRNQQEFSHRYVVGLYKVMDVLTKKYPHILFEGCASGGNRFDLGILCYMPQIWASDNTDAICRAKMQTNYSYGYPMSTIGAHVSSCPNHQTLRNTSIETRFNVAAFGVLGYECNIAEISKEDTEAVKAQISIYKKYRRTLQFGDYHRIINGKDTDYSRGIYQWISVSKEKDKAVGLFLQTQVIPNYGYGKFKTKGLDENKIYRFFNRSLKFNVKEFGDLINTISPIHIKKDSVIHNVVAKVVKLDSEVEDYTVTGSLLNNAGIKLKQGFSGTGFDGEVKHFPDFGSRIYFMDEVKKDRILVKENNTI